MIRGVFLNNRNRFPILPLVVLIVGSILVVAVFFVSFSPAIFQVEPVETVQEAKDLAEQYLTRYQGLEVEEIMEFTNNYYVIVKEGATANAAFELLVDRYTGRVGPEPGPNMMWNTKYGHHERLGEPTTVMPVDEESAIMIAQEWLNRNTLGYRVLETAVFYGYYTMDFGEKGEIFGMLSINGYSGDVWYHSWHGDFISMEEYS
jgi:hypothetical protein